MKITVVKIGDKFAVRVKSLFGKAEFVAKTDDFAYNNPLRVLQYCLFDTEEQANTRADMLRAVK